MRRRLFCNLGQQSNLRNQIMKISLLLTGNELMSGDTVDSNSAYIAQSLKDLSLVPIIKKVVGDDIDLLVGSIKELAAVSDVLVVNGGLGPTVDDLTALALSKATNSPLAQHAEAYAKLEEWAERLGFVLTESNLKQAMLPSICDIIDNPYGSAVGFKCLYDDCLILCSPGVPSEFKPMVEDHLLPLISEYGNLESTSQITRLRVFGVPESGLQDTVNRVFPDWPDNVELGFRVQMPVVEVKIVTIGEHLCDLNKEWTEKFRKQFADYVIGGDDLRLSQALNNALAENGKTLTTAESCTGGLISSGITSESGSSGVFQAGFITYSNDMKQHMLGVKLETLQAHGAVSQAVVAEMALGAIEQSGSDIAIAVSGVAGPSGGTDSKPVGTVWVAFGEKDNLITRRFFFPGSRLRVQKTAAAIAMDLVRRYVLGLPTDVDYFSELKKRRPKKMES